MESNRYGFSLTTFNPSGKLAQIEYALAAAAAGAPAVGVKVECGAVIATENECSSVLHDPESVIKLERITPHIGMVYSGMSPDYRLLVKSARKTAQKYSQMYRKEMSAEQLVQRVASDMQEYTQTCGVRPFGVSLLVCGWDSGQSQLFTCDPSGSYSAWKAAAIGKNKINSETFLENRYDEGLDTDDAVYTAIYALKEAVEIQMTSNNIQIGICDAAGFRKLQPTQIRCYLADI